MDIQLSNKDGSEWDVTLSGKDLTTDRGLETAVVISLFTDSRAENDDPLPDWSGDRRGWWADVFSGMLNEKTGSRLWLLDREKTTAQTLLRAEEYAHEALAWMIEDGIASEINVAAERGRDDILGLSVQIIKPQGDPLNFIYQNIWEYMNV